jgi:hypothetical protein
MNQVGGIQGLRPRGDGLGFLQSWLSKRYASENLEWVLREMWEMLAILELNCVLGKTGGKTKICDCAVASEECRLLNVDCRLSTVE